MFLTFVQLRIARLDTTKSIINGLSSRGPAKQKNAKGKLLQNKYMPRRETLANPVPHGYNRFIKPKYNY
jgi:hypothetical protein